MKALLKPWLALLGLWIVVPSGAEIPVGTEIQVRLKTKVSSSDSGAGDPIEAVLIAPVQIKERTVLPAGLVIRGCIRGLSRIDETHPRAIVELAFHAVPDNTGKEIRLPVQLVGVDNARETIDETGRITGILASETLASRLDQQLQKLNSRLGGLGALLMQAKGTFMGETNPHIGYPPGVELTLKFTQAAAVGSGLLPAEHPPVPEIEPQDALGALVNAQPFRTQSERPSKDSDITNLMFLGSQEQLAEAFTKAGWSEADPLTGKSKLETIRAVVENRGYSSAPVSILLLEGNRPDLVFQKQNNTFAKRHHLRIWRRPGDYQGRPVWISAATHDIGIEFSAQNKTFIHKIDPNIDLERAKVRMDLLFTGSVKGHSMVDRPGIPNESQNATGDKLLTDGKLAVFMF
jgi:hypothetical protein